MKPETPDPARPHPHVGRVRDAFAAFEAAGDAFLAAAAPSEGPDQAAQATGLLIALAGRDAHPDIEADLMIAAPVGAAAWAAKVTAFADRVQHLARVAEAGLRTAAAAGLRDPDGPSLIQADFGTSGVYENPARGPGDAVDVRPFREKIRARAVCGLWSTLAAGHPVRAVFAEADTADLPGVGRVLVLSAASSQTSGPYSVADVRARTHAWRDEIVAWRAEREAVAGRERLAEEARQRAEEARRQADPLWRVGELEKQVAELQAARA